MSINHVKFQQVYLLVITVLSTLGCTRLQETPSPEDTIVTLVVMAHVKPTYFEFTTGESDGIRPLIRIKSRMPNGESFDLSAAIERLEKEYVGKVVGKRMEITALELKELSIDLQNYAKKVVK